jgi:hypothetical protein
MSLKILPGLLPSASLISLLEQLFAISRLVFLIFPSILGAPALLESRP